ncbi:MAG: MOSC domain-containing protein [Verrucomicrobia bacterium]|nr:MOSC domain-containing protein [Verrucomicrobiota bacterium]
MLHLYRSAGHNFVGHHGQPPGTHPMEEVDALECVAGRGVVGDRYFGHAENYKGQITFFATEVYDSLRAELRVFDKPASVFRRNVITRGLDLNALIGVEFALQGVRFIGVEECRPCYWMDHAFGPGAEAALHGGGGLRARILRDGWLWRGPCEVDCHATLGVPSLAQP